ncbi:glycosyltransferase family 39 protein [Nostoc sp. CHAB 5844]|nr:glycosyltransferase family 39 protein [Nostoc sp. CHAB 5844]
MSINLSAAKQHLLNNRYLQIDFGLVAVLLYFSLLTWVNWGKLETPIIDIGREVEISARLADGQVLYRDVATYYGPLAYYANAILLLIFGHRLEVFYTVGVGLSLIAALLFYKLAKRLTNNNWAVLCTVCMLLYCALGPGIFNFIMPYSFGAVYAIVLSLIAIACLDLFICEEQLRWLVVAAIACGLAGLAKQEYGVSVLGSILFAINLDSTHNLRHRLNCSLLVILVAGACLFLPLAVLAHTVTWEKIYLSLFPVPKVNILQRNLSFQVSPIKSISIWLANSKAFFGGLLVVSVAVFTAHWAANLKFITIPQWLKSIVELTASVALAWGGLSLAKWVFFLFLGRQHVLFHPLQNISWLLPIAGVWLALICCKLPQNQNTTLLVSLIILALLLNARWGFYINFYGLYAVPVIILLFTLLYYFAKKFRWVIYRCLLVCILLGSLININSTLIQYQHIVNSPYGTFHANNAIVASALNQTIKTINASGAKSVLVLPEGNILNFLTATHSPSRELTFLPVTLGDAQEEQHFLEHLRAKSPQIIVYVYRSFGVWGYQSYAEFNPLVDKWITQQHKLIQTFSLDEGDIRIYQSQVSK